MHFNYAFVCQLAKRYFPDITLPAMDDDTLLETLDEWLAPYLDKVTNKKNYSKLI
ncbi:ATP-dependent RNA helicase HrpB [Providencia rustigianii]|nr:ATP-dependent RNA helicase HrpB [Providencia rustigianii]